MILAAMIRYKVNDYLDACQVESSHHHVEIVQGPDFGINVAEVGNIVCS